MAIDLNVTPYYNDFSAAKKFNRVIFKVWCCSTSKRINTTPRLHAEHFKRVW